MSDPIIPEVRKVGTDINKDTSPQILLFKAIDRKAFAAASGNQEGWESSINEIIAQLPAHIRHAIEDRRDEYVSDNSHWEPNRDEGITLSEDPHNPVLWNKPGDRHYNKNLMGQSYEVEFDEAGNTVSVKPITVRGGPVWVSPKWVVEPDKIDYTALNEILHAEMEAGNLTWKRNARDITAPGIDLHAPRRKKQPASPMY